MLMTDSGLSKAIERAGNASALARALNITPAAVLQWRRVPTSRVLEVEQITGVPREQLRPELYAERGIP
jgi:DNA-binding transcriptional regulator YdaS (Cro superfamily)